MYDLWSLGVYTRELRRQLPAECFRPVPARLWWMLPHYAIAAAGIIAIALLDLPWPAYLALGVCVGGSFACLGFLAHEILHGSVVANPRLRDVTGGLCFAPFAIGARLWRKWHNVEHHGHAQNVERDPDVQNRLEDLPHRPVIRGFISLPGPLPAALTFTGYSFWFSFHSFLMFRRYYGTFPPARRAAVLAQWLAPLAFWLALLAWMGPRRFLFAYIIPLGIANAVVLSYISTNHMLSPLTLVNDPLINTLSVSVPRWADVLHLGFAHHTEHHIFPKMNPRYAPRVRALVLEKWPERFQEMPLWKALRALWRTPRVYLDDNHLIDPRNRLVYPTLGSGFDPDHVVGVPREASDVKRET